MNDRLCKHGRVPKLCEVCKLEAENARLRVRLAVTNRVLKPVKAFRDVVANNKRALEGGGDE